MEDLGSSDQKLISSENMYEIGVEKVAPGSVEGSDSANLMSEMEYSAMSPDRADTCECVLELGPECQVTRCSPFWRQWVHRVTRKDSPTPCVGIRKDSSSHCSVVRTDPSFLS